MGTQKRSSILKLFIRRADTIILNDREHGNAVVRLSRLMKKDPPKNSPDGKRLIKLAKTIERYEKKRWPMDEDFPRLNFRERT